MSHASQCKWPIIQWLFNLLYLCHQGIALVSKTKKLQWNPVNMVINGQKKFCRINGVMVLMRVLYYQGGRKVGFHCTKFKKLRKVCNLPFFSVLGHFFFPKFPLTSLTKIPSMFLFSTSVYLKEIKTKNNVKYLYQNNTTCIT